MAKPSETTESTQQLYQTRKPIQIDTHTQQDTQSETITVSVQEQIQQITGNAPIHSSADFSVPPHSAVKNSTEKSSWKDGVKTLFRPKQAVQQEPAELNQEIPVQEQKQAQEQTKQKVKKESFARISLKQSYENETQERSLAYHQVLRENVIYDKQLEHATKAYRNLMSALMDYTSMNVTEGSYSQLSEKASRIQKLLNSYPDGEAPSAKELIIIHRYKLYFDTNFNGTLDPRPDGAIHEDYSDKDIATGYWYSSNYDVSDQPLFAKEPTVDDIAQRLLGDCYLQAALISMVQQDPQGIKSCMHDNGNGTVTVRFFQKDETNQTMIPKYVTVKKTVPKSLGIDTFSANNLWVQMIEKAYAASGLHDISENAYKEAEKKYHIDQNNPEAVRTFREEYKRSYSGIEGGFSHIFLTTLTGKEHAYKVLPQAIPANVSTLLSYQNLQDSITRPEDSGNYKTNILILLSALALWLGTYDDKKPVKYISDHTHLTIEDIEHILEHTFSEDTWVPYAFKSSINAIPTEERESFLNDCKKRLINQLENFKTADGLQIEHAGIMEQNGQGVYSASMLDLYNDIQTSLQRGITVCCGTRTLNGKQSGLNGESEANGMVGNHAYAILGCEEHDGHKFIRLRNPWNSGVKEYVKITEPDGSVHFTSSQRKNIFTKDTGTFLLDLADFKNTVDHIYY